MTDEERNIALILDTITEGIQANTIDVLTLLSLLEDKGVITRKEFNTYRDREEKKMEEMVEKALEKVKKQIQKDNPLFKLESDDENFLNGYFGKGGEA